MPYRRLPSLLALRAFEAVARNGSMKEAAEELSVTPGAVSQLVKKLEDQMDVTLLKRVNRGFELTQPGIRLNTGLAEAFIKMREAVDSVNPEQQGKSLLVACGPPFAAKWLVPRLPSFLAMHPDININITSSFDLMDYHAREVDIGIRLTNDDNPCLDRLWLGEETMMAMASPDYLAHHKITSPADLIGKPLLTEDTRSHFHNAPTWENWFESANLPNAEFKTGINFGEYVEQAIDAAATGAGIVLGRKVLASRDIENNRLKCLFGISLDTGLQYQIVCPKETNHKEHALIFKAWLAEELGKSLGLSVF